MTIKIEREAVLKVIGAPQSPHHHVVRSPCLTSITDRSDDIVYFKSCRDLQESLPWLEGNDCKRSCPNDDFPDLEDTDDETCTTVSSCADSTDLRLTSSSSSRGSTVSFAYPLVTEVKTRPRTRAEDVSSLFYSCEETQRFRRAYREERKTQHDEDEETISDIHNQETSVDNETCNPPTSPVKDHRISRVVVMHKDKLETFIDKTVLKQAPLNKVDGGDVKSASDTFFDNDNFWSGQITWY